MEIALDPEQFEIQISDTDISELENGVVQENIETKSDFDLMRASLSDVVITQPLHHPGKNIYNDENIPEVDTVDAKNSSLTPDGNNYTADKESPNEFSNLFDSPIKTSHYERNVESFIFSDIHSAPEPFPQLQELCSSPSSESALDFEDAASPFMFTSTLRDGTSRDSDNEFDFNLPGEERENKEQLSSIAAVEDKTSAVKDTGESSLTKDNAEISELGPSLSASMPISPTNGPSMPISSNTGSSMPRSPNTGLASESTPQKLYLQAELTVQSVPSHKVDLQKTDMVQQTLTNDEMTEEQEKSHIITSTAADWDNVATVEAGFYDLSREGGESMTTAPAGLAFLDMWQHFRAQDHSAVKGKIQVTVEKTGILKLINCLFGPPRLHRDLSMERELVFCAAATAFDNADSQHVQSLQTIYRVLTTSRFSCQRYGSHWEEIGFQGSDPATDLRGTGVLALVQLVFFLQDGSTEQLARDIYKLSLHPTQNFPFCVMCINISRIVLQVLREGLLNRECNRQHRVMSVVNHFYAGVLLHFYRIWKQGKTIRDSGFVIKDVETWAKQNTKEIFRDLDQYVKGVKIRRDTAGGGDGPATCEDLGQTRQEEGNLFSLSKSSASEGRTAAELY